MRTLRTQIVPALMLTLALAILLGIAYPVAVWGIGQLGFKDKVNGSFVTRKGATVGSSLLGQGFSDKDGNPLKQYFQPRPSNAGTGYDATASAASNLGPGDPRLIAQCLPVQSTDKAGNPVVDKKGNPVYEKNKDGSPVCDPNTVPQRAISYRTLNGLPKGTSVPVDAVTSSGSGLDPDISVANADLQAARVARTRDLPPSRVLALIKAHTTDQTFGFLGEKVVDVLSLNLALDRLR
jgi:K+-transporting ATPase ATPase C chain